MSGAVPRVRLLRPIAIRSPDSAKLRSGAYRGNSSAAKSAPCCRRTSSNQVRSVRTTARQVVDAAGGPAVAGAVAGDVLSCPHRSQNRPSRGAPQTGQTRGGTGPDAGAGGGGGARARPHTSHQSGSSDS